MKNIINIAILAHVDAGKTTLTEQLLYHTGALKSAGNVDKGTAATDFLNVEKERGISVIASHVSFDYKNCRVNIIDTPGHADFISEVERSLMAVDAVVLLISAADGVQAQTRVLWKTLEQMNIPRILLVNKIDRSGVFIDDVIEEVKNELSINCIPIQSVQNEGTDHASISSVFSNESGEDLKKLFELLSEYNDDLLEVFINDEIPDNQSLKDVYLKQVLNTKIFPIMYSVAKNGLGISKLLDELSDTFIGLNDIENSELSALIFKVSHHPQFGKLAFIRMLSGSLTKKMLVYNQRLKKDEKINLIKSVFSDQLIDKEESGAGEIIAVTGFADARVGDVLGKQEFKKTLISNSVPILTVQVKPQTEQDYIKLSEALTILNMEDPFLDFQWYKDEKEFHIKINGWIQIQILEQILLDRFQINAEFLSPSVIYKETPSASGIGYEEYTMPKPCWAVIQFAIEPGEIGSGVVFESKVGVNDILLKYQKEVERTIPKALEQGIKGWETTDLKITLKGGEDHVIHSRAGDFVIATPMAMMNGLKSIGTDLLEPIMKFVIHGPEDILGQLTSDLIQMRGEFEQPEILEGKIVLKGKLPVASSLDYPVKLASRTGGRANIQMEFDSYRKVETALGEVRDFKGISPLDRAKYILKARKAIQ